MAEAEANTERRRRLDSAEAWIRTALTIMVGMSLGALSFIVSLSNRMTAMETKMETAQQDRVEFRQVIDRLSTRVDGLNTTIVKLTEQLDAMQSGRRAGPASRMFDK